MDKKGFAEMDDRDLKVLMELNKREHEVRMIKQKIMGFLMIVAAIACFFIIGYGTTPENPEDMSGALFMLIVGFYVLLTKTCLY